MKLVCRMYRGENISEWWSQYMYHALNINRNHLIKYKLSEFISILQRKWGNIIYLNLISLLRGIKISAINPYWIC